MPKEIHQSEQDEKDRIITIREDSIFNYTDTIDKICMRKTPFITKLIRIKPFEPGKYKIRNGQTRRLTGDILEILDNQKILWIQLTSEDAKEILGADEPPIYGNYLRDLRKYWSRHEMSYQNHPIMWLHHIKGMPRPVQHKIGDYEC
jgi:hypothetical protein